MSTPQRQVLWTTCLSHGMIHVYELSVPAMLVLIQREFVAGDLAMGWVVTLYGLLFGVGALPAGYLADRFGSKALLVGCLWGASGSMVGMALSPSLGWFAAAAAAMGLALSIYHPAGTALISHATTASGRIFAIHGMAGNLGVASSALIAGVLGELLGWRWALGALALGGFVLGARVGLLVAPTDVESREREGRGQWPSFVLLLVAVTFMGTVYRGMTTFLPKFFATTLGGSNGDGAALGGLFTTAVLLVGLAGMYTAGRWVDRGARPAHAFLTGTVVQAPFLVALGVVGGPALLPLAMGVAFFHFFTQPPGNQMVARFTPPRLRGLGYGIYFFLSFGVGSFGAALCGWLSERVGLVRTFPALAVLLIPAILAVLALARLSNRPGPEQPSRADGSF